MSRDLPSVAILLATYNGAAFLDEQIASIAAQRDVGEIHVIVSDDGSTDGTWDMLEHWATRWERGQFIVRRGPGKGFAENFRALATGLDRDADYVAFCDQDDIWDADKLSAGIAILAGRQQSGPGLYFSRTRLVDRDGADIGFSPLFRRPPSFSNAIVQSIGGGNTVVLDRAGFAIFAESARRTSFVTHDWWCYIIISAAGGFVYYDPTAHIGYRQHDSNVVGRNTGLRARLGRLGQLLEGRFAGWSERNLAALDRCSDMLTPEAEAVIARLSAVRSAAGPAAVFRLARSGIYRQTAPGNIALAAAAFLGKV